MPNKVVDTCTNLTAIILPFTCLTMAGIMITEEVREIKRSRAIKKMAKTWEAE